MCVLGLSKGVREGAADGARWGVGFYTGEGGCWGEGELPGGGAKEYEVRMGNL